MVLPDWFLERVYPYTRQVKIKIETLASSKTILSMNSSTIKLIAVGITGCALGYLIGRICLPPVPPPPAEIILDKKDSETAPPAETAPPIESVKNLEPPSPVNIEQILNNKFDPILGENHEVIGFMYKMDALRKSLTIPKNPSNLNKIGYQAFPKTRDLLL